MLKITIHSSDSIRFQLEGRLAGAWVEELERAWHKAAPERAAKPTVIDLASVDFIDAAGRELLAQLHRRGAKLVTATPFMEDLVNGIISKTVGVLALVFLLAHSLSAQTTLQLSMRRAVDLAVAPQGATQVQIAGEGVKQAESRSVEARAALLPNIDGGFQWSNRTENLAAFGIQISSPFPGLQIPSVVGPYNVLDLRGNATQSVLDMSSIRRYQGSKRGINAAKSDLANTGDLVAAQVARAYVAAQRADADVEAMRSNVELARALVKLAENQRDAGTGTGLEVTRAGVQLANEEQRLVVAENERRRARLQLLRAIGLRLDTSIELTDKLSYVPEVSRTLEAAQTLALQDRADLKAQLSREEVAKFNASATKLERVPTISGFGDIGQIGTEPDNTVTTRHYGISVRVPVFDGGRRDARRAEANSQYRQEKIKTGDLRQQIELEVRLALDALQSADDQVKVAKDGLGLSEREFEQARRRYEAGVATGVEVTDAQTRLERARDNYTAALFAHNLARIDLASARGRVAEAF